MNTKDWLLSAVLSALCVVGCADAESGSDGDGPAIDDTADAPITLAAEVRPGARPEGWDIAAHDPSSAPDYARVFPDDRVQRIDIEMSAETQARIYDDLTQRVGAPLPPGTTGNAAVAAFIATSPAGLAACQDKPLNTPCTFLGLEGTCAPAARNPFGDPNQSVPPTCREDLAGALDMVPGDPIAVPVTVRYDGKVWNHVGMRLKGNSSLSWPWRSGLRKLGLRLDLDKFENEHREIKNQRFFGFSKLVFASAYNDSALIREKLASDLLREAGLPAARAAFYRVYVRTDGEPVYWGLYTMLEDPADVLPSVQFPDGRGNLYKPDGNGADFTRLDKRGFEKKSNEKQADYGDIERALAALYAPRDDAERWRSGLEATFDVDAFLGALAVGRAMDHFDSYGGLAHNYYLYGDPSHQGRLVFISWDHNGTWGGGRGRTSIMANETTARWPLIRFLLDDPTYRAKYRDMLSTLLVRAYEKQTFDAHATRLHTLIAPYVVGAEGEQLPYSNLRTPQSFLNALPNLLTAADGRRAAILAALEAERVRLAAPAPEATGTTAPVPSLGPTTEPAPAAAPTTEAAPLPAAATTEVAPPVAPAPTLDLAPPAAAEVVAQPQ